MKRREMFCIALLILAVIVFCTVGMYFQYHANKARFPSAPAWSHFFR